MRIRLFILALSLCAVAANAQSFLPPKVVRLKNVQIDRDIGTVYAGNANRIYALYYNAQVAGCRWKMPFARRSIALTFVEDMTVNCNESENIGTLHRCQGKATFVLSSRPDRWRLRAGRDLYRRTDHLWAQG